MSAEALARALPPHHDLLVEPGPPVVLTELGLEDGAYRVRAEHRGVAELAVGATVDLDALDRP